MGPGNIQDLTIPECGIVTPGSVKELVALHPKGGHPGFVLVIEQAVAEVGQTRPCPARYNLLERIKRIEGTHRKTNFRSGRSVGRGDLNTIRVEGERMIGRDGDCALALGYEIIGGVRRKFVVRLHVVIVKIPVNLELIVADFLVKRCITTPAFLLRERTGEGVEVKPREQTARRPNPSFKEDPVARWGRSEGTVGRSPKFLRVCGGEGRPASGDDDLLAQLKVPRGVV